MAADTTTVEANFAPAGDTTTDHHSYIDWSAIIAGAILAAAISFVLITFGSAIGLTLTSPYEGEGVSVILFGIATALWFIWVQVSSFMARGYLTGRMRRRVALATEHEVEVRDGAHGLLVWALGAIVGAAFAVLMTAGAVTTTADITDTSVQAAVSASADDATADTTQSELEYAVSTLFRSESAPPAADSDAAQQEILRIVARSADQGNLSDEDKAYLARVVHARTDLSAEEAEKRIDAMIAETQTIVTNAKEAAETARKSAIIVAFLTAATMLVSAAGAWWAAGIGGKHRDRGTVFV